MPKYMYDCLNVFTYLGVIFFTATYNSLLCKVEIAQLCMVQLILFFITTVLLIVISLKKPDQEFQASDILINGVCFFFGVYAISCLAIIPVQVQLTQVIPSNIEAAMTAVVTGTFVFSYEVGCKMSGSLFCDLFKVDNDHLDNYWMVLLAKLPCILIVMLASKILPTNQEINALG